MKFQNTFVAGLALALSLASAHAADFRPLPLDVPAGKALALTGGGEFVLTRGHFKSGRVRVRGWANLVGGGRLAISKGTRFRIGKKPWANAAKNLVLSIKAGTLVRVKSLSGKPDAVADLAGGCSRLHFGGRGRITLGSGKGAAKVKGAWKPKLVAR